MSKEIAKILLEAKAVSLRPDDPFVYHSGIKAPIYCDNRIMISYPDKRGKIVNEFLKILSNLNFDILAGTSTAGISWCAWLAHELKKPMVYVRKESKGYGKSKRIEGVLEKGQHAVIIEDLVSTGDSSASAVEAVRESGGKVTDCVAIFNYQLEKSRKKFKEADCNLHTLTKLSDLADFAIELNYINEEEKEMLLEWNKDPENWAKNRGFE